MTAGKPMNPEPSVSQARLGILLVVIASMAFATLDGLMKLLAERYSPFMLGWARHFFHVIVILLVFGHSVGRGLLRTRRPSALRASRRASSARRTVRRTSSPSFCAARAMSRLRNR